MDSVRTSSPLAFLAHQLVGDDEASNISCALSCWGFLNVNAFAFVFFVRWCQKKSSGCGERSNNEERLNVLRGCPSFWHDNVHFEYKLNVNKRTIFRFWKLLFPEINDMCTKELF